MNETVSVHRIPEERFTRRQMIQTAGHRLGQRETQVVRGLRGKGR